MEQPALGDQELVGEASVGSQKETLGIAVEFGDCLGCFVLQVVQTVEKEWRI